MTAATASIPLPAASPRPAHLELRGLGLRRGDRWLVRRLDLRVPRGAFVAVVGLALL